MREPFPDHGGCNKLIQEARLGKFSVSEKLIVCSPHDKVLKFMSNFIIIDCTYESDIIEYRAYSSLFDSLDQSQVAPHYSIRIDDAFNVTAERMNP